MAKKNKKRKIVLGCFAIIIIVFLVVIGSITYVLSAVFDEKPAKTVIQVPDPEALLSGIAKIKKALIPSNRTYTTKNIANTSLEDLDLESLGLGNVEGGAIDLESLGLGNIEGGNIDLENFDLKNLENLDLGKILQKIDLGKAMQVLTKPGKITLTKAEINALIDYYFTADKVGDFQDPEKPKVYDAFFENGRFTLKLVANTKFPSPFGRYCNLEFVFIPQVVDHHLKFDLCSAKAGTLSIPVSYFKDTIDSMLKEYEESDDGKMVLEMITSLNVEEDKVEMKYNFQNLSLYLIEKQHKLEKLNNSSEVTPDEILKIFQQ